MHEDQRDSRDDASETSGDTISSWVPAWARWVVSALLFVTCRHRTVTTVSVGSTVTTRDASQASHGTPSPTKTGRGRRSSIGFVGRLLGFRSDSPAVRPQSGPAGDLEAAGAGGDASSAIIAVGGHDVGSSQGGDIQSPSNQDLRAFHGYNSGAGAGVQPSRFGRTLSRPDSRGSLESPMHTSAMGMGFSARGMLSGGGTPSHSAAPDMTQARRASIVSANGVQYRPGLGGDTSSVGALGSNPASPCGAGLSPTAIGADGYDNHGVRRSLAGAAQQIGSSGGLASPQAAAFSTNYWARLSHMGSVTYEGGRGSLTSSSTGGARRVPMVRISVSDKGIGISKEEQRLLFRPFTQIRAGAAQKGGGTGLGLSICKRIMELSGGRIGVASQPGRGSTFFVDLPLKPGALHAHTQASMLAAAAAAAAASGSVIVSSSSSYSNGPITTGAGVGLALVEPPSLTEGSVVIPMIPAPLLQTPPDLTRAAFNLSSATGTVSVPTTARTGSNASVEEVGPAGLAGLAAHSATIRLPSSPAVPSSSLSHAKPESDFVAIVPLGQDGQPLVPLTDAMVRTLKLTGMTQTSTCH